MGDLSIEHLDKGIKPPVKLFIEAGFSTFESCEGGEGHVFSVPAIKKNENIVSPPNHHQ